MTSMPNSIMKHSSSHYQKCLINCLPHQSLLHHCLKPAPAPEAPKSDVSMPKPTEDQTSIPGPRNGPTNGKLGEMLSKKEEKVDAKENGTKAQPVTDKKENERKEEKPVKKKKTEKPPITEAAGAAADASTPAK
jgi:hypothetical protein